MRTETVHYNPAAAWEESFGGDPGWQIEFLHDGYIHSFWCDPKEFQEELMQKIGQIIIVTLN